MFDRSGAVVWIDFDDIISAFPFIFQDFKRFQRIVGSNGKLDTKEPIKVYWLNREMEPGKTNGLSFIQKKMAYGYKVVSITEHTCTITLTAYPEKKLTICREGDHFVCHVKIDNRQAILQSLYVKASPNNPLNVEYVELQGITTDTGVPVTEKVSK